MSPVAKRVALVLTGLFVVGALGLAAGCLVLALGLLQRDGPPADPEAGPHEDHASGTDRR